MASGAVAAAATALSLTLWRETQLGRTYSVPSEVGGGMA